jgi:hypothetical protein
MKAKVVVVFLVVLLISASIGCAKQPNIQRALSEHELTKFITDQKINSLATRHIGGSFTVILYETGSEMGSFSVFANQNGKVFSSKLSSFNNSSVTPVSVGYTSSGIPYATAIINDPNIQRDAKKIKVVWDNGHEIIHETQGKKGFIIPDEAWSNTQVNLRELVITDQDGKILFKQP